MAILQRLDPQNRKEPRKNIFLAASQPLFPPGIILQAEITPFQLLFLTGRQVLKSINNAFFSIPIPPFILVFYTFSKSDKSLLSPYFSLFSNLLSAIHRRQLPSLSHYPAREIITSGPNEKQAQHDGRDDPEAFAPGSLA
jgi:hypothetical protein